MHLEEDKALSNKMWVHMMIIRLNEKSSKSYVNLTYLNTSSETVTWSGIFLW